MIKILLRAVLRLLYELTVPRRLVVVKTVPMLGTGKTDYTAARQQAIEQLAGQRENVL